MSRYIDADFEIAHYTSMTTNPTPDVTEKDKRNSLIILDALRMAKSIEIIRCRECEWSKPNEFGDLDCKCHIPTFRTAEDGYCWKAERRR